MSSLIPRESETKNPYNRKEKSLGVLCSNFLKLYDRDGVDSIELDDASSRLGVERRRIYDIVNILESVGVLSRKAKNQYFWKGFGAIPQALYEIKAANENEDGGDSNSKIDTQEKTLASLKAENRKEKSLGLLARNFIRLFLCSDMDLISLDNAATELLGDIHDPTAMRTKARRLYDIANVLASMNLIEKTHHPKSGKPAYKWLKMEASFKNASATDLDLNESKRRVFGIDITNTSSKRYKGDSSVDWNSNQKANLPMHMKHNNLKDEYGRDSLEQNLNHSSKDFVFGPFTPANIQVEDSRNKNIRRVQDWENLASSYRPQYCNRALHDLFAHYTDAWKSWHVGATGKKHIQQLS
ncbi:E2F transcription factor-like E2FE isoform X2 [Cornus florida]|uniref:E2F transcription factor-like E2FE isoform X2 n=1 Tax=Cornus florida TaxID=4283 RepID=UPI0028983446|nr:E2F transcription factor-like E2FE isoform X2 [Cornus florida]